MSRDVTVTENDGGRAERYVSPSDGAISRVPGDSEAVSIAHARRKVRRRLGREVQDPGGGRTGVSVTTVGCTVRACARPFVSVCVRVLLPLRCVC